MDLEAAASADAACILQRLLDSARFVLVLPEPPPPKTSAFGKPIYVLLFLETR